LPPAALSTASVDIPQQGDVKKLGKTEATRALPVLGEPDERGSTEETANYVHNGSFFVD
jgi:hypothetical protein